MKQTPASRRAAEELRAKLGWRVTPELRYKIDRSVDAAERIATVLEEEHKWQSSITDQQ